MRVNGKDDMSNIAATDRGVQRSDLSVSVWLDHAAIVTADLSRSIHFYANLIGLRVHVEEDDPLRKGRRRAMLFDSNGRDVMEVIEMPELRHRAVTGRGAIHHLGFRFPEPDWHELVGRLEDSDYPFHTTEDRLFVRDVDGILLEVTRF